jgi:hypothetical protein
MAGDFFGIAHSQYGMPALHTVDVLTCNTHMHDPDIDLGAFLRSPYGLTYGCNRFVDVLDFSQGYTIGYSRALPKYINLSVFVAGTDNNTNFGGAHIQAHDYFLWWRFRFYFWHTNRFL